jgi:asparagine synthase (glutamine-hydrolysing)
VVPNWVITRPKRGFTPPVHEWHKAIFAAHGDTLKDGFLAMNGIVKPESGHELARGAFPSEAGTPLSFKALTLELWCRNLAANAQPMSKVMNGCATVREPIAF